MKAGEKQLIRFLEGSDKKFIIPIYQRNYDWKKEQCEQLFNDLVSIINNNFRNHFFGSVVYIYDENSEDQQFIIIDGQQRLTTVSLLLLAMYNLIDNGIFQDENDIAEKIRNEYLVDKYKPTDKKIKLKLIKKDRQAFDLLFQNDDKYYINDSNVTINYNYFYNWIQDRIKDIYQLFEAIKKLTIVQIKLSQGEDDPQLIFESLNSTGLDLNESDKIRNFVLMGAPVQQQQNLYENYWLKIEQLTENRIDAFAKCYLTIKNNKIPNEKRIYLEFKHYVSNKEINIQDILNDMLNYAEYYGYMIKGSTKINSLNEIIKRINLIESTVVYPYTVQLLMNYQKEHIISSEDLLEIFELIESFLVRRFVCNVQTSSLNKLFLTLEKDIRKNEDWKENYADIFKYLLKNKTVSQRFPNDDEFYDSFVSRDSYNLKSTKRLYLLERLENFDNVECVDIAGMIENNKLSIEHIMPQELTNTWKTDLGDSFNEIHEIYLNTIGNLTLTGYNQKYSNKPFIEKRDMEKGFKESKLSLNQYVSKQDKWGDSEIKERANLLFEKAKKIWSMARTDYKPIKKIEEFYTLDDDRSFTGEKISSYVFLESECKVKQWTEFYEQIIDKLYDLDHGLMKKIISNTFSDPYMNKRFSKDGHSLRNALKISDDIFVEKNLNTDAKLDTLRAIVEFYGLDLSDIGFYLLRGDK